jgi:hypothetical protein
MSMAFSLHQALFFIWSLQANGHRNYCTVPLRLNDTTYIEQLVQYLVPYGRDP